MNQNTSIPVRKSNPSSTDDAWDTYAIEVETREAAKAKDALTSKPDAILDFMDAKTADSIWDHPRLQGFFSFVETKIDQIAELRNNIRDINSVTLQELNVAMFNHNETYNSLVGLYNIAATEEEAVKLDFQLWFDELYVKARVRLNPSSVSAQKWASSKEIEAHVRVENKDEYKKRRMDVIAAERQTAFVRRLMEGWDGVKFSLNTISKNQQVQYRDIGNEDRF